MKKVFALVLAVAMVASLTAVSFAKTKNETHQGLVLVDENAYQYNADWNRMRNTLIQYGKAAYFPLYSYERVGEKSSDTLTWQEGDDEAELRLISNSEKVDGLKVKVDYEMGKDLVAENGVSIVKKRVEVLDRLAPTDKLTIAYANTNNGDGGYFYFVEIKTIAKETTSDSDIVATLELNKSKKGEDKDSDGKSYNYKVKDLEVDITVNVGYDNSYLDSAQTTDLMVDSDSIGDDPDLEPETYYLLKYDYDEDVEFTFGEESAQNEGTFTVDVSGQGKNLLYYDTIIDEAIADANQGAKIFALNFNNTKFNRTGEFMYEAEDMEYAYEVMADGSLKLLGEFDGEEVTFKTRVLGKYLFSDMELVAAPAEVEVPSVEVPTVDVTNPSTGAIA